MLRNDLKYHIKYLEPVLASIREAVIIADVKGRIITANPFSEVVTGYLPQDLVGRSVQEVMTFQCTKRDASSFLSEALKGWRAVKLPENCSIMRPNLDPLPVAGTSSPLYTYDGKYSGIVLVFRDLTEEAKVRRRQYEFLSFVSHQLRQPMGSFRWGIEIISAEKDRLNPENQGLLDDLLQITIRFNDFIRDLIDISRFEEGKVKFNMESVEIKDIVREVARDLKGLVTSHNVKLSLFPKVAPGAPFIIKGDQARLHDVFQNLLVNAIRYNKPQGTVSVEAKYINISQIKELAFGHKNVMGIGESFRNIISDGEDKKFLLISVKDSGLGIPIDQQANVFESFFRGKNVIDKGLHGTGLGLFIVKSIIERLNGCIFFESEENIGTTFYLVFPYDESD